MAEKKKKSWKTTVLGVLGVITAVVTLLTAALQGEFQQEHLMGVLVALGVLFPSLGAIVARDDDVSSGGTKAEKNNNPS